MFSSITSLVLTRRSLWHAAWVVWVAWQEVYLLPNGNRTQVDRQRKTHVSTGGTLEEGVLTWRCDHENLRGVVKITMYKISYYCLSTRISLDNFLTKYSSLPASVCTSAELTLLSWRIRTLESILRWSILVAKKGMH